MILKMTFSQIVEISSQHETTLFDFCKATESNKIKLILSTGFGLDCEKLAFYTRLWGCGRTLTS